MAEQTGIAWCDHTWNPWIGCTKVSAACDYCYAEDLMDRRYHRVEWGGERSLTSNSNWQQPLRWNRKAKEAGVRRRVFCASLADVFDNQVPEDWRNRLWLLIKECDQLDWLLLTKRPQNIQKMLPLMTYTGRAWGDAGWLNVWLGTTVENQEEADRRIPHLLATPAAVRFISAEPLLGPVDLRSLPFGDPSPTGYRPRILDALTAGSRSATPWHLDWVIAGGESGKNARPFDLIWAHSLRDQCRQTGVAFFMKQLGDNPSSGRPRSHHGADPSEFPADLRVREFPA